MILQLRLFALLAISLLPNRIKLFLYRALFGARIGANVRVGFGCLLVFDSLEIGSGTRLSGMALLKVRHLVLGQRNRVGLFTRVIVHTMETGPSVTIGPQVSILADSEDPRCVFSAGSECWIFEYCYINPARPIKLGRNVGVGGGSYLFGHGLWLSSLKGYPVGYGEITIGNDVWLPWGCFVMPGVKIGDGAVLAARSVVTRDVPPGVLVAGAPAKVVRERVAQEPSSERKIELLIEVSEEFAEIRGKRLTKRRVGDWVLLEFDGSPSVAIAAVPALHETASAPPAVLKVVHVPYRVVAGCSGPIFSLSSFQCSPRHLLTPVQADWLTHLRRIGTRHYPIDEIDVEIN
jgi:acetyltransferase-like isoleucine patch superfamily enzyme